MAMSNTGYENIHRYMTANCLMMAEEASFAFIDSGVTIYQIYGYQGNDQKTVLAAINKNGNLVSIAVHDGWGGFLRSLDSMLFKFKDCFLVISTKLGDMVETPIPKEPGTNLELMVFQTFGVSG